ncbi:SAM-dependent methyltransferase [Halobacteriales archaeon QS_1_68_17]|nr:MAG: SAM-dependent methyltransferase [Halobacteriales archaeon QS_1_68_17]
MNAAQRDRVLDNARYLREVRPVDPAEIHEYVPGQPHPAAVARVLREAAVDLGLVERDDGTFVPVEDGPVSVPFAGVERLPEAYGRVLEDLLVDRFGPGWPAGESGDRLRARIREIKALYHRGGSVSYDDLTALAYALYHLPDYYAAAQYVLADLIEDGLLDRRLRVLDVGAGVGGPALGLHDLLPADALVDYRAVEPAAAADLLDALLAETGRNFHASIHRETAESFDPGAEYDLIVFANVLSELADPAAVVDRYLDALAADGLVVALAPADRNTAVGLRDVERAVAGDDGATVYAPTVRLWPGESPAGECWSFDVRPDLAVPGFQRRLDEAGDGDGEFVNADVQYAFSILRTDSRRRIEYVPDPDRTAKMAETERHVTERIDLAAIKLSHDLGDGDNAVYLVGDGSERVDHFAVLTRPSALNEPLRTADYGDLLAFENVLVLWNDDDGAYNLVVDGETVVERVPA